MFTTKQSIAHGARFCIRFLSDDIADAIPDAVKMIQDGKLQAALGLTKSDAPLTNPRTRIAVLSHFTRKYGRPVSSADFPKLRTTEDVAKWYKGVLHPRKISEHGERIAVRGMALKTSESETRGSNDRIAGVQDIEIPPNLALDPKTFELPKIPALRGRSSREKIGARKEARQRLKEEKERRASEKKTRTIRIES